MMPRHRELGPGNGVRAKGLDYACKLRTPWGDCWRSRGRSGDLYADEDACLPVKVGGKLVMGECLYGDHEIFGLAAKRHP